MGGRNSLAKRILGSRLFLVLLAGILLLFIIGFFKAFWQDRQIQKEIKKLEQNKLQLETLSSKYSEKLKEAESPAFLERQARFYGGLVKPGEKTAMILETEKKVATSSARNAENFEENKAGYKLWWQYFFDSTKK